MLGRQPYIEIRKGRHRARSLAPARRSAPLQVLGAGALLGNRTRRVVGDHARVFHPPASIVSVVEAPRVVSSEASPTRPLWPVIRPAPASSRIFVTYRRRQGTRHSARFRRLRPAYGAIRRHAPYALRFWEQWYERAIDSGIAPLVKFAKALKKYNESTPIDTLGVGLKFPLYIHP